MEPLSLYATLLLAGFVLIGMEIFIPGGVLGIFGTIAWLAAAVVGWRNFPEPWNMLAAAFLLFAGIATFFVWIRFFPKSRIGRGLSLADSTAACKAHRAGAGLEVGTAGEALTTLRPSGIALFAGKRVDVVADGEWIEAGQPVKISSTSGAHVSVVKA